MCILFLRQRETEQEWGRGRERERETEFEAGSRLWAVSTDPEAGLELTNLLHPYDSWNRMLQAPVTVTTKFIAMGGKADRLGLTLLTRVRPRTARVQNFYSRPHHLLITWEQNKEIVPRCGWKQFRPSAAKRPPADLLDPASGATFSKFSMRPCPNPTNHRSSWFSLNFCSLDW